LTFDIQNRSIAGRKQAPSRKEYYTIRRKHITAAGGISASLARHAKESLQMHAAEYRTGKTAPGERRYVIGLGLTVYPLAWLYGFLSGLRSRLNSGRYGHY
jgi:hypothetical protein